MISVSNIVSKCNNRLARTLLTFSSALIISLIGTLPLGILNVTVDHIATSQGAKTAIYFAIGAIFVEMIYVLIALTASTWINKIKKLFFILKILTAIILLYLGFWHIFAYHPPTITVANIITPSRKYQMILYGMFMSAINFIAIPFWLFWSSHLIKKGILRVETREIVLYIFGIAFGTVLGFLIFVQAGQIIVKHLALSQTAIQSAVGLIFIGTAILQLWGLRNKKDIPIIE